MLKHCKQVNGSMLSIIVMGAAMKYYLGHATFKNRFQTSLMLYEIIYNSNWLLNNSSHSKNLVDKRELKRLITSQLDSVQVLNVLYWHC